jgi:hypothetical protein
VLFGVGFAVGFSTAYPLVTVNAGIVALCAIAGCVVALALQFAVRLFRRS